MGDDESSVLLSISFGFSGSEVWVPLLFRFWVFKLLVKVVAAFWAAEKTEEKNPPPPRVEVPDAVLEPGVFASSIVGVNGAEIALDNLLG